MKLFGDRGDRRRLPVYFLTDSVLFPGVSVPLVVRDERDQRVINSAMEGDRSLVMVPRRGDTESDVGTVAHVHHVAKMPDGAMRVVVEGRLRVRVADPRTEDSGVDTARTTTIDADRGDPDERLPSLVSVVRDSLQEYLRLHPTVGSRAGERILAADGADRLVDLSGGNLPLEYDTKIALLGEHRSVERVSLLADAIQHQVELLGMKRSIRDRVRKRLESGQKEYFLQEQIKEINRELGKDDQDEGFADLERRISEAELPEPVQARAERELRRLRKLPPVSPESGIIQTYLDWLLELPWHRASHEESVELASAREILDGDHYAMREPKDRLLEFLAVQSQNPDLKAPILCFVGPPGTGKTSLGRSLARALNRQFVRLSLGGIRDEAEIRGHRRTYVGAMPGRIIQSMRTAGTHDPVMLLDEIDKLGADFRGDPASALLEVLDPEQNATFSDHYVELEFDLSQVIFLTTANDLAGIPRALRDRLEIIPVPGYTEDDKVHIARDFLVPEQNAENGRGDNAFAFRSDALHTLIHEYTQESGVRTLKRQIATVIRKLVREQVESGGDGQHRVTAATVRRLLGPPPHRRDTGDGIARPGLARGLAWTEAGGVALSVEAVSYRGNGQLVLTGNLGDVMKESARTALSLARARAEELGIAAAITDRDIHVHVPEGAVPKDGPSAGITIFSALLSLFLERPLSPDVAMTGELTLTGRVLPVGGVREKVLAARRAEIHRVIVPAANGTDLDQLPRDARRGMTFHTVRTIEDVLALVFETGAGVVRDDRGETAVSADGLTAGTDRSFQV